MYIMIYIYIYTHKINEIYGFHIYIYIYSYISNEIPPEFFSLPLLILRIVALCPRHRTPTPLRGPSGSPPVVVNSGKIMGKNHGLV